MAQPGTQLDQQQFCCSICLDLLKDPVTVPCGHSYCMSCIQSHLDEEDQKETHSCPLCRQTFVLRPTLVKNTMLSDLMGELKKTGTASADHCHAGPGDVACDVCTERKLKAVKSCLHCLVSYCEQHLQPHYKSPAFEKHKLVNPAKGLQENICSRHNEVIKIFCRTDQMCICYLCYMDEHKGHNTVSAATEMAERQKEIEVSWQKIQQRIQTREEDMKVLRQQVEAINTCANNAMRESEKIINQLKQQIRSRQIAEVSRAKELQEKLEQEIVELRRKDAELQQLSHTEDHTEFLNKCPSLSQLTESSNSPSVSIHAQPYFEEVKGAVSEARDKLQDVLIEELSKISLTEIGADVFLPQQEPKSREDFLKYAQQVTLDPNTAHKHLYIEVRSVRFSYDNMDLPEHPNRFTLWPQVLCRETLTGRCYWEVEWDGNIFISMAYKNISRNGIESTFGNNHKSWALKCSKNGFTNRYEFRHNNIQTSISGPQSSTVGMYLDHRVGVLSFYSISDMTLLHRVETTFTQPLCPGLAVYNGSYAVFLNTGNKRR
uniref:tripartite motif-containing protein 16-like n=1 Tax=Monopterus albus TaxID=43700 RepID=UPI0009B33DDE|nr:tripartite motif-containing protein 16-like [Monopterus albus]